MLLQLLQKAPPSWGAFLVAIFFIVLEISAVTQKPIDIDGFYLFYAVCLCYANYLGPGPQNFTLLQKLENPNMCLASFGTMANVDRLMIERLVPYYGGCSSVG